MYFSVTQNSIGIFAIHSVHVATKVRDFSRYKRHQTNRFRKSLLRKVLFRETRTLLTVIGRVAQRNHVKGNGNSSDPFSQYEFGEGGKGKTRFSDTRVNIIELVWCRW